MSMKHTKYRSSFFNWTVRLAGSLGLSAIAACGGGSSADSPATVASPAASAPAQAPCFNPGLYAVGTQWTLNYKTTNGGVATNSVEMAQVVRRTRDFQNTDALEIKYTDNGSISYEYMSPDFSAGLVFLGYVMPNAMGGSSTTLYNPPYISRHFLMQPGSTETETISRQSIQRDANGVVVSTSPVSTTTNSVFFAGYEDVTIAAGTFKGACKFVMTNMATGVATTRWRSTTGQGIMLKQTSSKGDNVFTTLELQSGTVNGEVVR